MTHSSFKRLRFSVSSLHDVHLCAPFADFHSLTYHVRTFLLKVGPALTTVTCLTLHFENSTSSSNQTTSVLLDAAAMLFGACPALLELRCFRGRLTPLFMQELGERCPLLITLDIPVGEDPHLHELMQQQAAYLPHLNKLTLRGCSYSLPNMTENTSILTLDLAGCHMSSESEWLCLPSKLRHLLLNTIEAGPPPALADGTATLKCLQSVTLGKEAVPSLHGLAELLRASPALQILQSAGGCYDRVSIECVLGQTTAADLCMLHGRTDLELVKQSGYWFDFTNVDDQTELQPVIATLPCMTGMTACILVQCNSANMGLLLNLFPDIQYLVVRSIDLDDVGLFPVASCKKLEKLHLFVCNGVTPIGVAMLCQNLPTLTSIACQECDQLPPDALAKCAGLLKEYGKIVRFARVPTM